MYLCKGDYLFATAKDPLIRCDCVRTDRNLSMLEQNLKGHYIRATWIIPVAQKSNVHERYWV